MATRQPTPLNDGVTVIGPGIAVNGRVSGEEDLYVEGRLEGSVALTETFHVAANGTVVAEVKARDVVISGVLIGNVTADDSVTLNPGAKLAGDIAAPRVIIADGAAFSGNVAMGGEAPPKRERRAASRSRGSNKSTRTAAASTAAPAAAKAPPRVAAIPVPNMNDGHDEEVTVVVRHAAIEGKGGEKAAPAKAAKAAAKPAAKKKAKKSPPRARVPKPGKRRVGRR